MGIFLPLPILEQTLLEEFTEASDEEAAADEETEDITEGEESGTEDKTEDVATFPFSFKLFHTEAIDEVFLALFNLLRTAWNPDMI